MLSPLSRPLPSRVPGRASPKCRLLRWLVVLLSLAGTPGCTTDVAGPEGVDEPFTLYGIINPRLEQQTMLVATPATRLTTSDGGSIDARVSSTDVARGRTYIWRDSVVANATGQLDHVYVADFRPDFGSRHVVEVARSDGAAARATVSVPNPVTILGEDTSARDFYVEIHGEDMTLIRLETVYTVRGYDVGTEDMEGFPFLYPVARYTFDVKDGVEHVDAGWRLRINLNLLYEEIRGRYNTDLGLRVGSNPICSGLGLFDLEVSFTIGSHDWNLPGGRADRNVLADPGVLKNVENGLGFVGGGYNDDHSLFPSAATLGNTYFFDFIDGRTPQHAPGLCQTG